MDTTTDDPGGHNSVESGGSHNVHAQTKPRGKPYSRELDWKLVVLVGASVAVGAALGAGVALLTAPQSGEHTRLAIASELRRRRPRRHQTPWEKLSQELQKAARMKRFRSAAASGRQMERDRG